ncbi:hypothetical protein GARC_0859 [Paraglaciecola arctica BSs20135]|uniref:Uncharacterized protein n=1 Tax=Paraglaciecola arctica BSs20135 TaxID=493475 RepID=K6Z343_9ALTE|nr:hypothetical protein GARC_0859 [Paraglaciecola arctica BSs20135]
MDTTLISLLVTTELAVAVQPVNKITAKNRFIFYPRLF